MAKPRITFGIIVLNGEPFTQYCLRSLYPYAYEIIVVEGGHEDTRSVCTPDGHSVDGTLEALHRFKENEDPEGKVTIVTRDGFWPKKDEMGRDRTPQSRAYAERATGDYLWQVDIDEFYRPSDMEGIIKMLEDDPEISAISFRQKSFWGDIHYISEGWYLRRFIKGWHRIFKWGPGYKYVTHEPPTVINEEGMDLRKMKWIGGDVMAEKKIYMYHYSLLFPWQVEQKVKIYEVEKPNNFSGMVQWAENNFFKLGNPFRVHNVYKYPSWLERFVDEHPPQIVQMMKDIQQGKVNAKLRGTDDIEKVVNSSIYNFRVFILKLVDPIDKYINDLPWYRFKNIPGKLKKIATKIVHS